MTRLGLGAFRRSVPCACGERGNGTIEWRSISGRRGVERDGLFARRAEDRALARADRAGVGGQLVAV